MMEMIEGRADDLFIMMLFGKCLGGERSLSCVFFPYSIICHLESSSRYGGV